jgi:hemolysin activation/secretion protein
MDGAPERELKMTFPDWKAIFLTCGIEQGMEQINRARTTPVQIEILPADKQGGWRLFI